LIGPSITQGASIRSQQGRQEGQGAPAAVRHLGDQPGAASAAPVTPGHIGLGPGLVDKDQARGIKPVLVSLPSGHVGAILLGGVQAFFLNVIPSRA
jgi:hypothetical protein